ncbi:polysaccharide pyruvyl transferase family protein [uncultured Plantibacter sp.]|uniref:polysaccharide pyruvyl transferase family protein n=1 Tax=uncultured Plantibacter sp. TaxID=293337 RepID=UPI0028D44553|nr:polysaccharide pyruvyl transferase family protein [uncultured Plantibacter sp.]
MLTPADAAHLEDVRARTAESLSKAIGSAQDVALLDAPSLINVGDSMIWEGQVAYMKRLGLSIRYRSDMQSYSAARLRRALPEGGVVLLRGGGNFGDVWLGHQAFRERVARDLPDIPIVQLTQSVLFRDPARAAEANRILGAHPAFTLLVRDELSYRRAAEQLPDVQKVMSYDMALGWDPSIPVTALRDRAVVIARDDREASSGLLAAASSWEASYEVMVTDWGHNVHPQRWADTRGRLSANGKKVSRRRRFHLPFPVLSQSAVEADLAYLNTWNVDYAVGLFSSAKAMVVDRLHAHVLASLLGIPHVVLDNDHGKISTVFEAYTGGFSTARYTTSTVEAREILDVLMAAQA